MAISDDFDRIDNVDMGTNWDVQTGLGSLNIAGNRVRPATAASQRAENYNATTPTNNQFARITLATWTTTADIWGGVMTRASAAANTAYITFATKFGTILWERVAGSDSTVATDSTIFAITDVLMGRAEGTIHSMWRNGIQVLSGTGSAIASGRVGVFSRTETTVGHVELDNFEADDIVSPAGPTTAPSLNCWMGGWW
jgi:hypothetical protein